MKLFSLTLVSLVSPFLTEYECGEKNEPHFHHYRSKDFMGHFKIGNSKYKIAKPLQNEDKAYTSKRKKLCAEAKHAINIYSRHESNKGN